MTPRKAVAPATETTPLRRQYLEVKGRFPDAVVLFRLGDFYETFDEDARVVSEALEIVLTSREMGKGQRVPMAGIPHHALDGYLARLIRQGHRVAICEQTSDPATSRGLVDRDVVRVVTPGTVVEPALLEGNAPNYLAAIILDGHGAGLAYADITTSTYATTYLSLEQVPLELERLAPAETLVPQGQDAFFRPGTTTDMAPAAFDLELATERILQHFGTTTLEPFGCQGLPLAVQAAGAILAYLEETQRGSVRQITSLHTYSADRFMALDPQTRRNLELFQGGRFGAGPSLLGVLDFAQTPMGGRLLREWLGQPLLNVDDIRRRQDAVEWLVRSAAQREETRRLLRTMADLERLVNRVRGGAAQPRELQALRRTLEAVPRIRELVGEAESSPAWLRDGLHPCTEVVELVANAIVDEPSLGAGGGETIRAGLSPELDELRTAQRDARGYVAGLEAQERASTGIPSLKVGYNRVFGYYLEVTRPHLGRVPEHYVRRQTLVNAERFITPELKEYESRILNAQERIAELESALFQQVCRQIAESSGMVLATAAALAQVDVFAALAEAAFRHNYTRPVVDESDSLEIEGGRHPIVERALPTGSFVPNAATLSNEDCSLVVLTGPNMAGKSTYIRQVALIVLMAQIGSFVPASSARIGLVDRILHPGGLAGRPGDGPVHVHGGDGGDGGHPAPRDAPLPGGAGRDWQRHQHLRRPGHCTRGGGVHPQPPTAGVQDPLRHALPRACGPGVVPASRVQLQRGGCRRRREASSSCGTSCPERRTGATACTWPRLRGCPTPSSRGPRSFWPTSRRTARPSETRHRRRPQADVPRPHRRCSLGCSATLETPSSGAWNPSTSPR